jgi:hypothetical protein
MGDLGETFGELAVRFLTASAGSQASLHDRLYQYVAIELQPTRAM